MSSTFLCRDMYQSGLSAAENDFGWRELGGSTHCEWLPTTSERPCYMSEVLLTPICMTVIPSLWSLLYPLVHHHCNEWRNNYEDKICGWLSIVRTTHYSHHSIVWQKPVTPKIHSLVSFTHSFLISFHSFRPVLCLSPILSQNGAKTQSDQWLSDQWDVGPMSICRTIEWLE